MIMTNTIERETGEWFLWADEIMPGVWQASLSNDRTGENLRASAFCRQDVIDWADRFIEAQS